MLIGEHEERRKFVGKMAFLLKEAKPSVKDCTYSTSETDDIVTVTLKNDYQYKINVTGNSLTAIVVDVFDMIRYK